MERAVSTFEVTAWNQTPYDEDAEGPHLSRATVRKAFEGDLAGESTAELLMCQTDPEDLDAGAGYVASERVVGELAGRSGSFVLQHGATSGPGGSRRTWGHVVPGSGTGELERLAGTAEIVVDEEGGHTITLEYELP